MNVVGSLSFSQEMKIMSLGFNPDTLELPSAHFIAGQLNFVGNAVSVVRPSDGLRLGEVPDADERTVDEAVETAHQAWRATGWAKGSPRDRGRVLRHWADLIDSDAILLAQLEAASSTRPVSEAFAGDVPFTAEAIRFFGELADKLGGDVVATSRDSLGFIASEPYGVVGAIAPWNFPLSMCSWKVGPALAAGNAVVLKPSELTPFSTVRLAQLAIEAGMPPGIFNVVHGYGHIAGAALVSHPKVAKVSFTGSTRTGAEIMASIARSGIKPVTLELGGKSPQLVFEHVEDIEHTADCIVRGFTSNAGQACVAGSRLIAHERIVEPLLESVIRRIENLGPAMTWNANAGFSPIISRKQAHRVHDLVAESVAQGAEVIVGGGLFEGTGEGAFYRPTILRNVTDDMTAVREELFGPVLTVQTFRDEEEGILMSGHAAYGLAAGVHTRDLGQALRAVRGIAAGTVWVNRYNRSGDMMLPTGGFGQSGIGKDLGIQAVEGNLRLKSVLIDMGMKRQVTNADEPF
jgi:aldehyde dehydrogenase (NAD+)